MFKVFRPALETSKDYGTITDADKKSFLFGTDSYIKFLRNTKRDLVEFTVVFEVNHDLFKGFLLAPHQIKATAKMKDKVAEVEKSFLVWIQQMERAATQGNQIRRDPADVGPANELEYWRSMYVKYTTILEFTSTRAFLSFSTCLKLSRSKLLKVII